MYETGKVVEWENRALKEHLVVIIIALVVPFLGIFISFKTKNLGRDEKYNRVPPSCLDNSHSQKKTVYPKCIYCHKAATNKFLPESNADIRELNFCSEECKQEIIAYVANVKNHGMLFLSIILGTIFLMVIANGIVSAFNYNDRYGLFLSFVAMSNMLKLKTRIPCYFSLCYWEALLSYFWQWYIFKCR